MKWSILVGGRGLSVEASSQRDVFRRVFGSSTIVRRCPRSQKEKVVRRRERVAELSRQGVSAAAIARETAVTTATVYNDLKALRKEGS